MALFSQRFGVALLGAALALAGCAPGNTGSARAEPQAARAGAARSRPTHGGGLTVLGFWTRSNAGPLSTLAANSRAISALCPFWYSLDAHGTLTSKVDPALLKTARKLRIPIQPMVNDATGTQAFLASSATRTRAVQDIDRMVASMGFQGVNIDFEPPHTHVKPELTAFLVQLRDTLPKSDRITLDVVPYSGGAYDYRRLASEVDDFVLMSYDQHSPGTIPGPVAALNWVQAVETRLRRAVPSSKIYLGVALYGYAWTNGSKHATTVPYARIPAAAKAHGTWDARYQEMTARVGGQTIWWENRKGISEKIALARRDHLAGIALWDIGYADRAIYQLLRQAGTKA